ncbi:MAG: acyl-CoA dehydrogenase family protein [Chloroflexota bacterium]|nr:acyl-CoA dehydrogenase family protein [Chloroflexota bacterium]
MDFKLTESQQKIQSQVHTFARDRVAPFAREMDESGTMPPGLIEEMASQGFLGGPIPREYGGGGWDAVSLALCYEELGCVDSSVRGMMTVHTSLVSQCIAQWGSQAQKREYLPRLARGEMIGCYCLTEPNAGSDAASMETTATRDGDDYLINGEKIWITNGNIAHLAIVFANADPSLKHKGICAFLVHADTPGFRREKMPGKELGHRASDHAHIIFDKMRVPQSALLGAPGEGFKVAMSALDRGRLGVAAGALGVGQACLDACVTFAKTRRQFGQRIGNFEMIQSALADMAADIDAARMLVYRAAWLQDQRVRATRETSIAKLFAVEAAVSAANEAVLLHGGRGYSNEFPVERYYRDIKGLQIYEGTAHIQRIVIARELLGRE